MLNLRTYLRWLPVHALTGLAILNLVGCRTASDQCCTPTTETTSATAAAATTAAAVNTVEPKPLRPTVRINAGSAVGHTNTAGIIWLPDQGFVEGDVVERPDLAIANTTDPTIYRTERYSMQSFAQALPNGDYTVKLHFAETFEGITAAGERVFSFNVEGQEFKDFDVFVKAGGPQKAYVETVPVKITDGKLDIIFTPKIENPQINGIEIIPEP